MKKKSLFMETTEVPAEKTAAEVTGCLVQAGARRLMTEYDMNREISGIRFELEVQGKPWCCVLPARVEPIFKIINGRRKYPYDRTQNEDKDRATAKRVAWRQLLRWVQAQLAMIETGMVESAEVFLPYVEVSPGVTMFERIISNPNRQIEAVSENHAPIDAEFADGIFPNGR